MGLWKPEGFQAEPQRFASPASSEHRCPSFSAHSGGVPPLRAHRQSTLTGHTPLLPELSAVGCQPTGLGPCGLCVWAPGLGGGWDLLPLAPHRPVHLPLSQFLLFP